MAGDAVRRNRVIISDVVAVGVALAVVLVAGLTLLYVGKPWGTTWDVVIAVLAAAGGTLTVTPLVAALDQLGGTEAKAS